MTFEVKENKIVIYQASAHFKIENSDIPSIPRNTPNMMVGHTLLRDLSPFSSSSDESD